MLNLGLGEYERWAPEVVDGLKRAARFLHQQYVYDTKFLPYGAQLIPLAAILATLSKEAEPHPARQKLAQWYWCGVFGELYGGTTETRFSRDLPEVVAWVRGGPEPRTVTEAGFASSRLLTMRTRGSAAYKGLYALLLREGAVDWRTGEPGTLHNYFDEAIDIHHVFPRAWCERQGLDSHLLNSIVNKTPLTARTNRVIGGYAPSEYLTRLANSAKVSPDELDGHVRTHLADSGLLRADDFRAFFEHRSAQLLERIEAAMGKALEVEQLEPDAVREQADEGEDDTEDVLDAEPVAEPVPAAATSSSESQQVSDQRDVEKAFASAMRDVYVVKAKQEAGYNATYFVGMLADLGPRETARRLVLSEKPSEGFTALWERGRLDLTVEAVVLQDRFRSLFADEELEAAERRLSAYRS